MNAELQEIKQNGANAFWDDIPFHENPFASGNSHQYGFEQEWQVWADGWNMAEHELNKPHFTPATAFQHGEQFWPKDHYPSPSIIPHLSYIYRFFCWVTLGHKWGSMLWVGMDEPDWPQLDYCVKCWKFRRKLRIIKFP